MANLASVDLYVFPSGDVNDIDPVFLEPTQTLVVDETSIVPVSYSLTGATVTDTRANREENKGST